MQYDVVVIGGGHAGIEAAWAAGNALASGGGGRVAMVSMNPSLIGTLSCNPAIGGLAKGQIVREIDALGGLMGELADATGIMFKVLNSSRGAAVRGPRCQSDKYAYRDEAQRRLAEHDRIDIIESTIETFFFEDDVLAGVLLPDGEVLRARFVVLTTGTFMRALMHTGAAKTPGGRVGEGVATGIAATLRNLGFELGRLKTGTPPRLARESIDWEGLAPQAGDDSPQPFSFMTDRSAFPVLEQIECRMTATTKEAHDLIRANLHLAPMYSGAIDADAGPRYCPSIEDKVVRFADRDSHHVFLEPESLTTNEIYCNGISTSLPKDVQVELVRAMDGCHHAEILKMGYAVEYDMVWPHQIDATCETKRVRGLFLAGQINGTSGYEEAAGQGLLAGLNAARGAMGKEMVRFGREEAYIGVMMDDLVTRTPREPYRMFTSRAEHRLRLRADNADERLTPLAQSLGLVAPARWEAWEARRDALATVHEVLASTRLEGKTLAERARRPETTAAELAEHLVHAPVELIDRAMNDLRYESFIRRQDAEIKRQLKAEHASIPRDLEPASIVGLRIEAREVLSRFRPQTMGQAGRLAGVNPADLSLLAVAIKRHRAKKS